jgi:hypothetical protein
MSGDFGRMPLGGDRWLVWLERDGELRAEVAEGQAEAELMERRAGRQAGPGPRRGPGYANRGP